MLTGVLDVRRATLDDLEQLLTIAAERRSSYAEYQPWFWRPARDAVDHQRAYFASLLDDDQSRVVAAVEGAELHGFAIARLVPAPPVYDPGGPSCLVDDFAVVDPGKWSITGPLLLGALRVWAAGLGAVQLVVVTAHLDDRKRAALQGSGLTPASEWWVGPVT